jgi:hypothetical protein
LAIVAGMGVADVSENGFALGWDKIELPNPLFAGDTLYSESEVLEKRESKSKPQWGIVKVRTRGLQQEGKIVIDYVRSVMVWKRAHAPRKNIFRSAGVIFSPLLRGRCRAIAARRRGAMPDTSVTLGYTPPRADGVRVLALNYSGPHDQNSADMGAEDQARTSRQRRCDPRLGWR